MERVQVNYLDRDFNTVRRDLIDYLRTFFPDQWQDFNVASPGMALLELNAYVTDLLSHIADKKFIELYLDGAQSKESIYRLAKTKGYKVPGVRPALCLIDIVIEVPATADGPDADYLPVYRRGVQVKGAGQTFETIDDIDFSSDFSEEGIANRTIEPILNGNQNLVKYRILKREKIKAGITVVHKENVGERGGIPFLQIELPQKNVLEVVNVAVINGDTDLQVPTFSTFNDTTLKYYEVDYLPNDRIFVEDDTASAINGIQTGQWLEVKKRFEKEFKSDGSCVLTFGGGDEDYDAYSTYLSFLSGADVCQNDTNLNISDILDNVALGHKIPANATVFVQYRVGGGSLSNVGANTLTEVANVDAVITGPDPVQNNLVISSTRANNPIPALGGKGLPSIEEIRYNIAANHAAQDRCVTLNDYTSRAYQLPGKFGGPFRIHATTEDNKVKMYILTRDGNGKLVASSTSTIKENLVTYMSRYRMINDFIEINDGKVINLEINADLFIDRNAFAPREVKMTAANVIKDFMDVERWQMNQHLYVSQLVDALREVPGVINVVNINFYNLEGGGYSNTLISQATGERTQILETGGFKTKIELLDNSIFSTPISMFEIRNPSKDVRIRVA
jgi:hypothetical protein